MSRFPSAPSRALSSPALALARRSARHPWRAIGGWLVLVALAVVLGNAVGTRTIDEAADAGSGESGRADAVLARADFGERPTESVLVSARDDRLDEAEAAPVLADLTARMGALPRVARVRLPVPYAEDAPQAARSLALLRGELVPQTLDRLPGTWAGVTGATAGTRDFSDGIAARLPVVIAFVLALTFLLLLVAFRSLAVAVTGILLNLLSVAAAYGVLVLVFQTTWAEGLLGFTSTGAVVSWLPLFLFVILFGLSMDYHIFVLSRIREAALAGLPPREAVARGITASAGIITSAAAVIVAVFSIFATLSTIEFKQMGVGLAVVVLLDATLVRAVLLPATMAVLGSRNWYLPRWLGRLPALRSA